MEQLEKTSMPASKRCSHCKIWKPVREFWKNKYRKDGLHHECKPCHLILSRRAKVRWKIPRRAYCTRLERERYHRIQDEVGCHTHITDFYPAYRFLRALAEAEVVEV